MTSPFVQPKYFSNAVSLSVERRSPERNSRPFRFSSSAHSPPVRQSFSAWLRDASPLIASAETPSMM